jgi:hypothetical protein
LPRNFIASRNANKVVINDSNTYSFSDPDRRYFFWFVKAFILTLMISNINPKQRPQTYKNLFHPCPNETRKVSSAVSLKLSEICFPSSKASLFCRVCPLLGDGFFSMNDPGISPYYEITVRDFDPELSVVAIGFGDKTFDDLPGCHPYSYSFAAATKRPVDTRRINLSIRTLKGKTLANSLPVNSQSVCPF